MGKEAKIICRVSSKMKSQLEKEAKQREEAEAVIIREALSEYFAARSKNPPLAPPRLELNEPPISYKGSRK